MRKKKEKGPQLQHLVSMERKMRLVTYDEGAKLYGMGRTRFVKLAKEAKANLILKKQAVVDVDKFEAYLSKFKR